MSFNRFAGSARPSLGVELELQLVDARTLAITGAIDKVLAAVPAELADSIKPEFYDCCAEINTGICLWTINGELKPWPAPLSKALSSQGVRLEPQGLDPTEFPSWCRRSA